MWWKVMKKKPLLTTAFNIPIPTHIRSTYIFIICANRQSTHVHTHTHTTHTHRVYFKWSFWQPSCSNSRIKNISVGLPVMIRSPYSYNLFSLSWLISRSLNWCLAVDLWIYFHQILDEGPMMTFRVVINQKTGEDQFRMTRGQRRSQTLDWQ